MYSSLVDIEDEYQIVTTSFVVNHFKLKLINTRVKFNFLDGSSFLLPISFCDLTLNCLKNEFVTIKVIFLYLSTLKVIIFVKMFLSIDYN
jgi:hypothetical protein